jgi:hypothetical protein
MMIELAYAVTDRTAQGHRKPPMSKYDTDSKVLADIRDLLKEILTLLQAKKKQEVPNENRDQ